MHVVDQLKKLVCNSRLFVNEEKLGKTAGKKRARRDNVKVGQGGTLDPLADGVLVVGVGKGTKKLNDFLDCTKVRVVDRCFFTQANTLIGVSYNVPAGVRDRYVR